jgi:predicted nucleic acid-binding Zn ribbon protein
MKPEQLRARVLAEWRGLPEHFERPDRANTPAESVRKLMKSLGLADRLNSAAVLGAWKEIAGEFFALHSSPQSLKDGVLYVHVLQPTVRYELDRIWKREILDKLKNKFGNRVVREIKFRLG